MVTFAYDTDDLLVCQAMPGGDRNFSYIVADPADRHAVVVDPGFHAPGLAALCRELKVQPRAILVTHGHRDHWGAAVELSTLLACPIHAADPQAVPGAQPLVDGQRLALGKLEVTVIATPGHCPDHLAFLMRDALFVGDLLFCGKVGGTGRQFAGSSASQQWDSLQRLLKTLPRETRVFPGHDYYGGYGNMRMTSLGYEYFYNPFLLVDNLEQFEALKANWPSYKQKHGIR